MLFFTGQPCLSGASRFDIDLIFVRLLLTQEHFNFACWSLYNSIVFDFMVIQRGQRRQPAAAFASGCHL